jgi:hypothetical protein
MQDWIRIAAEPPLRLVEPGAGVRRAPEERAHLHLERGAACRNQDCPQPTDPRRKNRAA